MFQITSAPAHRVTRSACGNHRSGLMVCAAPVAKAFHLRTIANPTTCALPASSMSAGGPTHSADMRLISQAVCLPVLLAADPLPDGLDTTMAKLAEVVQRLSANPSTAQSKARIQLQA